MTRPGVRSAALIALFAASAAIGCSFDGDGLLGPGACDKPEILQSVVASNPDNVLSALVTAQTRFADSVAVRFEGTNGTATPTGVTPALVPLQLSVTVPVLALFPTTNYALRVLAFNKCGTVTGAPLGFATQALPQDLPTFSASGPSPAPGYVAFAAGNYGLVIDNTGRVVWYHRFPNGPGLSFQPQPNGRYMARPNPAPGELPKWMEIDPLGNLTRTLSCARGLPARPHDILVQPDSSYWLLCDETRTVDLSSSGGSSQAQVSGTVVQHISATGQVQFDWSPFDHIEIDLGDLQPADLTAVINWTHGNSLDLDSDGNLLVSFRNLSTVLKIDSHTGAVIWRMGGSRNQFTFENVGMPPFARQHGVRAVSAGHVLLLDNLGDPVATRAERYAYDEVLHTVRLSNSYFSDTPALSQIGGSTQGLPNGHALVSFGSAGSVEEYDETGNVVWRILGNSGYVFHATRIRSVYRPGVGDPH